MFKRSVTAACKMSRALLLEQTAIRIKSKDRGSFPVVLIQYQSSMQSECRNLKPPKEPLTLTSQDSIQLVSVDLNFTWAISNTMATALHACLSASDWKFFMAEQPFIYSSAWFPAGILQPTGSPSLEPAAFSLQFGMQTFAWDCRFHWCTEHPAEETPLEETPQKG